jgi:prolipoprotein diacylglyceryl transferase
VGPWAGTRHPRRAEEPVASFGVTLLAAVAASIPSPDSGAISIGPLQLRAYGLMIALGVVAAVWLAGRRFEQKGIGTKEDMTYIALWAVPAGIIGARLYHVITDWQRFEDDFGKIFRIWEGGLGIWGGIGLGVAAGVYAGHRRGIPLLAGLDAVAPALPLAQAIGRLGNWWNQELFGRPTDLPWGLEIAAQHRPAGYEQFTTFHPTFLYESLWNLLLCGALLLIDRQLRVRPGRLIVMYVAGYTFARFFIEGLRIDTANMIAGLRVNEWVSLAMFLLAAGFLVVDYVRHRGEPAPGEPVPGLEADSDAVDPVAAEDEAPADP